ncbi:hypothetical protein ACFWPX_36830 [Nocardia sp. NPDC058518]|uniref:hypothetical protein n=1 Tax=Nocardia sp. NPDC058518 TaxID=3346534 RepID=UPI00365F75AE
MRQLGLCLSRTEVVTDHRRDSRAEAARGDPLQILGQRGPQRGDSVTDVLAADSATLPAVAYANKPGKVERFAPFAPAVTITSLSALLEAVRGKSIPQ